MGNLFTPDQHAKADLSDDAAVPPNEPTAAELAFVTDFVDRKLRSAEGSARSDGRIGPAARAELGRIIRAFSDLESADGGNYPLRTLVDQVIDLDARLAAVELPRAASSGRQPVQPSPDHQTGQRPVELEEFLAELEVMWQRVEPLAHPPAALSLLAAYLQDLIRLPSMPGEPVGLLFLLRDTLLLYLGARHMRARGVAVDPRPAMINRALLKSFAGPSPRNPLYARLYSTIFESVEHLGEQFGRTYLSRFQGNWRAAQTPGREAFDAFLECYLQRVLDGGRRFQAIDSGAYGTMPILAMITDDRVGDLRMFTAAPWMQDFYVGRIHSPESESLRPLEQLACHERLYSFAGTRDGRVYVTVSQDRAIVSQSLSEIRSFMSIIDTVIAVPASSGPYPSSLST